MTAIDSAPFLRFADRATRAIAQADWLSETRVRNYLRLLLALNVAIACSWVLNALVHGGVDAWGRALGTDFTSFWAASKLALAEHATWVYDPVRHYAEQMAAFGGADIGFSAFFYPPPFLLVCLPLALAPYPFALAAWLLATGYACWQTLRAMVGAHTLTLAMAAFPAAMLNALHGQNAFLTVALFAAGLLMLDKRPWLAGLAFGALVCKPQLGLMLPVMLLAGGQWKTIISTAATALALCLAATFAFGADIWQAFLAATPLARATLEDGLVGYAKMQSVFAAVRLIGGGDSLAYSVQSLSAILSAAALVWVQRRAPASGVAGPAAALATVLASPFLLDYDLMLLAIPLIFLHQKVHATGILPWEKSAIALAYILPLIARSTATYAHVPLTPFVAVALFAILLRRTMDGPEKRTPGRELPV